MAEPTPHPQLPGSTPWRERYKKTHIYNYIIIYLHNYIIYTYIYKCVCMCITVYIYTYVCTEPQNSQDSTWWGLEKARKFQVTSSTNHLRPAPCQWRRARTVAATMLLKSRPAPTQTGRQGCCHISAAVVLPYWQNLQDMAPNYSSAVAPDRASTNGTRPENWQLPPRLVLGWKRGRRVKPDSG